MNPLQTDPKAFIAIQSDRDLTRLFDMVRGGNDAIVKEVTWATEDEMLDDLSIVCGSRDAATIVMYCPYEDAPVVEFLAVGVERLNIVPCWEVGLGGRVEDRRVVLFLGAPGVEAQGFPTYGLVCERLYYRVSGLAALKPAPDAGLPW
jgi:hypothetical protein